MDIKIKEKCKKLRESVKNKKKDEALAIVKELVSNKDNAILSYALTIYAEVANDSDYPFFANYYTRDKKNSVRAASLIKVKDAPRKIFSLYKNSKENKDFYIDLLCSFSDSNEIFMEIFDDMVKSKSGENIVKLSDIADQASIEKVVSKLDDKVLNPELIKPILLLLIRIVSSDRKSKEEFKKIYDKSSDDKKKLLEPVIARAGEGVTKKGKKGNK